MINIIICRNAKFHENPSSERRVVPCGLTEGHDTANRRCIYSNKSHN